MAQKGMFADVDDDDIHYYFVRNPHKDLRHLKSLCVFVSIPLLTPKCDMFESATTS
jgi:hypothetical protein